MRDIIWTVIIIWIVWKIYGTILNISKGKVNNGNRNEKQYTDQKNGKVTIQHKSNKKSQFSSNHIEYVDYEEVK